MERKAEILKDLAREVYYYGGGYEDIAEVYDNLEDLLEASGYTEIAVARAVFFGNIKNWNDDYFAFDGYANFCSCSEREHQANILAQEEEIIKDFIDTFKDNLEDFREELEFLGVDIDNLD